MSDEPTKPPAEASAPEWTFAHHLALLAAIAGSLALLGYLPTVRLAGPGAVPAMIAAWAVNLAASVAGTAPFRWFAGRSPADLVNAALAAIVLRLAVAVVLTVAAVLSGLFANMPLLIWVAVGHAALLVADTIYARSRMRV